MVTHVIFDMDGLLLDTERLYTEIMQQFLSTFGRNFTWEIKCQMMGRSRNDATQLMIDVYKLPVTLEDAKEQLDVIYKVKFPASELMPGAEKLIGYFHHQRVPMAVATGSDRGTYLLKTQNHSDVFSVFNHVVTSDDPDVRNGKPAPDIFLTTMARFSDCPSPSNVLVFEDSIHGVKAAEAAGMPCVWVPDTRADTTNVTTSNTFIIKSLLDFNPSHFGLPQSY